MIRAFRLLFEILRGVGITGRHFVANMWFHSIRLLGVKRGRPGAVTIQYPETRKPLPLRHRSLHRLTLRPDGSPRCVACMLCVTVCPSECIFVEAGEIDDPEIQKTPLRFDIDLTRCCFCGFCVEACPEDAIRMDTSVLEMAEMKRQDLIYNLDRLKK